MFIHCIYTEPKVVFGFRQQLNLITATFDLVATTLDLIAGTLDLIAMT
jgi:hypothetical protein